MMLQNKCEFKKKMFYYLSPRFFKRPSKPQKPFLINTLGLSVNSFEITDHLCKKYYVLLFIVEITFFIK